MTRLKKPAAMASAPFARLFGKLSKQALIDALYCASQLGTNDSEPQIATQAARNAVIALIHRRDRVPGELLSQSKNRIDSDGHRCAKCGSTEGAFVPPGSGDAFCLHCGADWPSEEDNGCDS